MLLMGAACAAATAAANAVQLESVTATRGRAFLEVKSVTAGSADQPNTQPSVTGKQESLHRYKRMPTAPMAENARRLAAARGVDNTVVAEAKRRNLLIKNQNNLNVIVNPRVSLVFYGSWDPFTRSVSGWLEY